MDSRIGRYVIRYAAHVAQTLAHLCESVITDEPVTRCGRRLAARPGTGFDYQDVPAIRICKRCDRRG
jgi:hypothetical protein